MSEEEPAPGRRVPNSPGPANPFADLTPWSEEMDIPGTRHGNYWCLASSIGELSHHCVADLLRMVVAGNPSVCIADSGATVTPHMLETGCLKLARTSAEIILLPFRLRRDRWTLAVIPLTGHRPISLFDSHNHVTGAHFARQMVADFLEQLAANWPASADGGRRLPAGLTRNPPLIVPRAGPVLHDACESGVYIVMAAMFTVTGTQLPKTCHWGLWRRLFCLLLSLEPRQHPRVDDHVRCLVNINHPDWNSLNPQRRIGRVLPPPPPMPVVWTLRTSEEYWERYKSHNQLLDNYRTMLRDRHVPASRRLGETLTDMAGVVAALCDGAPETAHGDGDALDTMAFARDVVQQALVYVGNLAYQHI